MYIGDNVLFNGVIVTVMAITPLEDGRIEYEMYSMWKDETYYYYAKQV